MKQIIPCVQQRKRSSCLIVRKMKEKSNHSQAQTPTDVTGTPLWTQLCSWVLCSLSEWIHRTQSTEQKISRASHNVEKGKVSKSEKEQWEPKGKMARDHWSISLLNRQTISRCPEQAIFLRGIFLNKCLTSLFHVTFTERGHVMLLLFIRKSLAV